jgi:hypothetical protein
MPQLAGLPLGIVALKQAVAPLNPPLTAMTTQVNDSVLEVFVFFLS